MNQNGRGALSNSQSGLKSIGNGAPAALSTGSNLSEDAYCRKHEITVSVSTCYINFNVVRFSLISPT